MTVMCRICAEKSGFDMERLVTKEAVLSGVYHVPLCDRHANDYYLDTARNQLHTNVYADNLRFQSIIRNRELKEKDALAWSELFKHNEFLIFTEADEWVKAKVKLEQELREKEAYYGKEKE